MQRNSPGAARGGPVALRPVRVTHCNVFDEQVNERELFCICKARDVEGIWGQLFYNNIHKILFKVEFLS